MVGGLLVPPLIATDKAFPKARCLVKCSPGDVHHKADVEVMVDIGITSGRQVNTSAQLELLTIFDLFTSASDVVCVGCGASVGTDHQSVPVLQETV
jgi:hypothetical protein